MATGGKVVKVFFMSFLDNLELVDDTPAPHWPTTMAVQSNLDPRLRGGDLGTGVPKVDFL
jgi:hypothetical protein